MKPITFEIHRQCQHKTPCEPPPEAEPETRWRSSSQITVTPPKTWTRAQLEQFIVDLAAHGGITDICLIEFRGGPEPGIVTVNGSGHSLSMALTFIPDSILGPWLLAHREDGNVWCAVHRPQPKDIQGRTLAPVGGA